MRSRCRAWKSAWFASVLTAAACSSFGGATSPDADAGPDAAADSPPAPPPPAPPPSADAGGAFCSHVDAAFCWSFDEGDGGVAQVFGAALTPDLTPTVGVPTLTLTTDAPTPPSALVADEGDAAGTDAGIESVRVRHALGATVTQLRCEADIRVDNVGSSPLPIALVYLESTNPQLDFVNVVTKQDPSTKALSLAPAVHSPNGPGPQQDIGGVLAAGAFFHVVIELDGGTTTVTVPGATPAVVERDADAPPIESVSWGIVSIGASGARATFDDLVCYY